MTMPFPKKPLLRGTILAGVGMILVAVACWAPSPTALDEEAELPAVNAVVEDQAPPISELARGFLDEPIFTPFTVRPDIKNRNEIARAMEENYPRLLRDAGVMGTVNVWFFIDERGITRKTFVNTSSGHRALDDAALEVAEVIEFTPAMDRDKFVPVWISLPITFTVRSEEDRPTRPATPMGERDAQSRPVANPPVPEGSEPTPFTNPPVLLNTEEVVAALQAEYPPLLRDAGVEGTAQIWFHIDAEGRVERLMVSESSGNEALDDAALRVASQVRFSPAKDGDEPVAVWISLPIQFTTR